MRIRADGTAALEPVIDLNPIRFNVREKTFTKPADKIKLNFSSSEETLPFLLVKDTTQASQTAREYIESFQRILAADSTTTVTENIWGKLPTFANYTNLEELYDVDEIQELYMQAAKKRGW